jgi:hypothetical protein
MKQPNLKRSGFLATPRLSATVNIPSLAAMDCPEEIHPACPRDIAGPDVLHNLSSQTKTLDAIHSSVWLTVCTGRA